MCFQHLSVISSYICTLCPNPTRTVGDVETQGSTINNHEPVVREEPTNGLLNAHPSLI